MLVLLCSIYKSKDVVLDVIRAGFYLLSDRRFETTILLTWDQVECLNVAHRLCLLVDLQWDILVLAPPDLRMLYY